MHINGLLVDDHLHSMSICIMLNFHRCNVCNVNFGDD